MEKSTIAITIGDILGIGPEIVIKAMTHKEIFDLCSPVIVGDCDILYKAACLVKQENTYDYLLNNGMIYNVKTSNTITPQTAGQASYEYIKAASELCDTKKADAIATAPISKENLKKAKVEYIGHTEIFAGLTNTYDPLTMFETDNLRIFFLSRHISLSKAIEMVKQERIFEYIKRCQKALTRLGINQGTMAVASLNPHSGENGLFGNEEQTDIYPAVKQAIQEGYNVTGPVSSDSVFHQAHMGKYNSVLSLYHDQGHIASKTLDFTGTISLTLGLPYLRTSVDHGTAPDIAWKGIADETSMVKAILIAANYAPLYK